MVVWFFFASGAAGPFTDGSSGRLLHDGAQRDEQALALDPHRAFVGAERLARLERDHPVVQRTGYRGAVDDALRERPALVGAVILDSEDLALGRAEHRDPTFGRIHATRAAARDVAERADLDPLDGHHAAASAKPTVASGWN